jgi:hypothetical protein
MKGQPFTLALYRVKPGNEDEFVEQWRHLAETILVSCLAAALGHLDP